MENSYDDYDYDIKYTLIGDKSVGKTKLIYRFEKDEYYDGSIATVGFNFIRKKLKIEDKMIRLSICDTSGGCKFSSFNIKGNSACVIFVYDIKDKKSFDNIPKYLENFQNNDNKPLLKVLVGNKVDDNENRQVKKEEGIQLA